MKKTLILLSAMALTLLTACNKEMAKPEDLVVNPNPLEVRGGIISADITGSFPAKKFLKKGILTVTPVLKYDGQETLGEPVTYVGEKAKANGTTVPYKAGGTYEQSFSCKYVPAMAKCELYLRFTAVLKKDTIEIPDLKIADGVMATAQRVAGEAESFGQITPDKYQRIIQEYTEADIKFLIQQANLRSSETKSEAIANLRNAIKAANDSANKAINKLEVSGYASPDGTQDLNEGLAERRQSAAQKFLQKQLKKDKIETAIDKNITAEDWAGFQELMESSNIKDKELVLRVLSMYSDPEEREAQIKNLAAVYSTIADEILPALRRSRLILTTDLIGRSDDEILAQYKADASVLSLEELLYAATLVQDAEGKKAIYRKAIELHAGDYRAYNNLGLLLFQEGNVTEARRCFDKALSAAPTNADVQYNAGLAALAAGDLDKAGEHLGKAAGTNGDLGSAMGTYYTLKGDYANATKAYGKTASNAAAVQQILNEDYAGARQTLAAVKAPNASTAYLTAVVGARTNDREAVYANLKSAIAQDAALKAQAAQDIEFAKFAEDEAFKAIVK